MCYINKVIRELLSVGDAWQYRMGRITSWNSRNKEHPEGLA